MGFLSLDNSWYKTHDIFLRKGGFLVNYVIDRIDKDEEYSQLIRRLCRYMSLNPYAKKSKDYGNNIIIQNDLKDSLLQPTSEGTFFDYEDEKGENQVFKSKKTLYNSGFDQEMKRIDQCYIFVHNYRTRPTSINSGEIYIRIDIIIPNKYDDIIDFESGMTFKRGDSIAILIDDMLSHKTIDDEKYVDYVGNLEFMLVDYGSIRLTKTSDGVLYSLVYNIKTARGEINNGNI